MIDTVIFDWKRTLYDPDNKKLIEGTEELLEYLKSKKVTVYIVGKGGEEMYTEAFRLLSPTHHVSIKFVEKKTKDIFKPIMSTIGETLFIGDRMKSELAIDKQLGALIMWVRQGKFKDEGLDDDPAVYVVSSLTECLQVLNIYFRI